MPDSKAKKSLFLVSFVLCTACLLFITLFSRSRSLLRILTLDPFNSYRSFFAGNSVYGKAILRNIALFVPLGYLLSALAGSRKKTISIIIAGALLSLLVETAQYYSGRGNADLDDLFNNTLGMALGVALYLLLSKLDGRNGKSILRVAAAPLLVLAGIIGCVQMNGITGGGPPDVGQFDFRIGSVDTADGLVFTGICRTYYMPTPAYKILLKGEKTVGAETVIDGDTFTARADVPADGTYEIIIQFRGRGRFTASTFIRDGRVEYVGGNIPEPPGDPRLDGAILKAYSSAYDTYVFEKNASIIWLVGYDIQNNTEIIFNIGTNEPELLPEWRKQYEFDNLGFHPPQNETSPVEHYRVFQKDLPDAYNITSVAVGFNFRGTILWSHRFRTEKTRNDGA